MLNLLDLKEVFSYKTSSTQKDPQTTTSSTSSTSLLRNSSSANLNKENLEEATWIFQKFKESFYELVYKFPRSNYLKENCINNCIEFYLLRKLLPLLGNVSISGIKDLLEKYLSVKNKHNITVRKFVIEALHKKLKDFFTLEQKHFAEEVIKEVLIPCYEKCLEEDDLYYRPLANSDPTSHVDLFEMKYFIVVKLIDLTQLCLDEDNMLKIIKIFEKIILMEKTSSIEILIPVNLISPGSSLPLSLCLTNNSQSLCPNYLYRIINHGLIDVFEKYFYNSSKNFTFCCIEIFEILIKYLEYFYQIQCNHPSSLSSIATETLNNLIQHQNNQNQSQTQSQSNQKYFNYYATIRRDVFEFLLRIRSNSYGKVLLVNRTQKRKYLESKYLILNLWYEDFF